MREILFRAKTVFTDRWIIGNLAGKNAMGEYVLYPQEVNPLNGSGVYVSSETVCQYTGLDDRTGVKIFEGDIIRFYDDTDGNEDGRIYWQQSECRFCVHWECGGDTEFEDFDAEHSEVVGNVFDSESKQA